MVSKIIKHPVTGIVISIVVTAAFFFFIEQKEIKPRYAVSEPETLAEATADAPGLELLWEGEKIENVHSISIVIWNAGRQFLDKNSISMTEPIRIAYPPSVKILYANFTRTSRDGLKFTVTDLAGTGVSAMQIEIVGDEALEWKDGGLLKILYSGPRTEEFVVTGRIKGSKEGFARADWNGISTSGLRFESIWILVLALIPVLASLGSVLLRARHWGTSLSWPMVVLPFAFFVVMIVMSLYLLRPLLGITWLR